MGYFSIQPRVTSNVSPLVQGFELAWEWNQTDVSQFEGSAVFASGGGAQTLTANAVADTDLPYDFSLDLASTGTGTGKVDWLATDPLVFVGEDRSFLIEWVGLGIPASRYGGFSFLADDAGTYHTYSNYIGAIGWDSRVDAGVSVIGGGTTGTVWDGSKGSNGQMTIIGRKPSGTPPEFLLQAWGMDTNRADIRKYMSSWDGEPAPASWNALACDRWGLSIQASGSNPFGTLQLLELRVYVAT